MPAHSRIRSFTLTELLVAMAVITVLSVLTLISVRAVAKDARLASATNTVMASLDNARALAMKRNSPVLVAFYPRLEGRTESRIDILTAAWTGDSIPAMLGSPQVSLLDRFEVIADVPVRSLPSGIKIAGPRYFDGSDAQWIVMTELTRPTGVEAPGQVVGVMYGPDGTVLTGNPSNDSDYYWVDLDRDGKLEMFNPDDGSPTLELLAQVPPASVSDEFIYLKHPRDEVAIALVPFLAVFDDEQSREIYDANTWFDEATRTAELSAYITQRASRIHFNRYTGVAMK